jgi:hypothetical protein
MNEAEMKAHFEALNAHLLELRPIFDEFCDCHGFHYLDQVAVGRYPRIRIERRGPINLYFDLETAQK